MAPNKWIEYIKGRHKRGSILVTLETRESATEGSVAPMGSCATDLIEEILTCDIDSELLLFEPLRWVQSYFVRRLGSEVTSATFRRWTSWVLETIRLGLEATLSWTSNRRRDTMRDKLMRESRDVFHLAIRSTISTKPWDFTCRSWDANSLAATPIA